MSSSEKKASRQEFGVQIDGLALESAVAARIERAVQVAVLQELVAAGIDGFGVDLLGGKRRLPGGPTQGIAIVAQLQE